MYQTRDVSLMPVRSEDEISYSNSTQSQVLLRESDIINTIKNMSDRMADLQQKIARLSGNQNDGALRTPRATAACLAQQPTQGATSHSNTQIAQSVFEEQNPWLLPQNRRSTVSEGTLINTNYNDQPLNQISSMVSIKREPIAAQTVTATNAQLQLQTDKGALQSYDTHSGLGLNQSNLSDYLVEPQTAKIAVQTNDYRQYSKTGQRLTQEPICKLPTFDGSGSLKMFRCSFQEFCLMNGYTNPKEVCFWLKQCFRGRVNDILYDECPDLPTVWTRLENRFGDHLMLRKYSIALPIRKRQPNESLTKLADDIRRMSNVVYFDLQQDQKERLSIMHFTNALQNPMAQYDISQKAPKTLEEALHYASVREMFFGVENQSNILGASYQKVSSNDIRSYGSDHKPCPADNQRLSDVNPVSNPSHPLYSMPSHNNMPQSGQRNHVSQNSLDTQWPVNQHVFKSGPMNTNYIHNQAANIGSANQGFHYSNLCHDNSRGKENFQPISQ